MLVFINDNDYHLIEGCDLTSRRFRSARLQLTLQYAPNIFNRLYHREDSYARTAICRKK